MVAGFLTCALLSSCVKGDDDDSPQRSFITFFNAAEGQQGDVLFYIEGSAVRTGALPSDSNSIYNQVYAGSRLFQAAPAGQNLSALLAESREELTANKYYSCFLTGSSAQHGVVFCEDSFAGRDSTGKARVRFINISSTADKLDLNLERGKKLFAEQVQNQMSGWAYVDTTRHLVTIYKSGEPKVKLDSINIHPRDGAFYTLYLRKQGDKHKLVSRLIIR